MTSSRHEVETLYTTDISGNYTKNVFTFTGIMAFQSLPNKFIYWQDVGNYHNPGQSEAKLSNLEWYYYRKITTTPSPHTTTTPPPHVPLQLKAIQCIQYYVNCTVQRCMTSIAINVCYHYILGGILSHFSYDTSSIQQKVIPSVGHQQVWVSNITIRKVFLCVIW